MSINFSSTTQFLSYHNNMLIIFFYSRSTGCGRLASRFPPWVIEQRIFVFIWRRGGDGVMVAEPSPDLLNVCIPKIASSYNVQCGVPPLFYIRNGSDFSPLLVGHWMCIFFFFIFLCLPSHSHGMNRPTTLAQQPNITPLNSPKNEQTILAVCPTSSSRTVAMSHHRQFCQQLCRTATFK